MNTSLIPRVLVDGRIATADQLRTPALLNYGHITSMQVRGGQVRGLQRHLDRLDLATRELFDTGLDGERVRAQIRRALGRTEDASVRVTIFWPEGAVAPSILVAVNPPPDVSTAPQRLQTVQYQRPLAHIKHVGGFAQTYYRRAAHRNGFDEALLVGPDGAVAEGAITNIGFFAGDHVVWPSAPALHGITMQLLEWAFEQRGWICRREAVNVGDIDRFDGAFLTNSAGIAPVHGVDDRSVPACEQGMGRLERAFASVPWEEV